MRRYRSGGTAADFRDSLLRFRNALPPYSLASAPPPHPASASGVEKRAELALVVASSLRGLPLCSLVVNLAV